MWKNCLSYWMQGYPIWNIWFVSKQCYRQLKSHYYCIKTLYNHKFSTSFLEVVSCILSWVIELTIDDSDQRIILKKKTCIVNLRIYQPKSLNWFASIAFFTSRHNLVRILRWIERIIRVMSEMLCIAGLLIMAGLFFSQDHSNHLSAMCQKLSQTKQ